MTAETYSIWTLYLAPALLHSCFLYKQYYKHFIQLIQLLNLCMEFEITQTQIDELEVGFQNWIKDYEWCVFHIFHLPWHWDELTSR